MANDYIYQMMGVEKRLPTGRTILQPTYLSFFPDAKIGVLGHNGSGKSTLLRIMAGVDENYNGQTIFAGARSRGYLAQEPELVETITVRENIELALKPIRDLMKRFDEVNEAFGDPDADAAAQAQLEDWFPGRTVYVIEMLESWYNGGGAHCHTNDMPLPTEGD